MNLELGINNELLKKSYEKVIGLTVVEKARNAITVLSSGLNTIYTAGMYLLGAAYAKVTKDTAQATFAMNGFRLAMASNPIGVVVTLVTELATSYFLLRD